MKKENYYVISNTHWDREWYQSHEKYLVRLVELMDRLVEIMEQKPDYRFVTDGQYALVEDYLNARPQNRERVKKLVADGRLLVGPWYTQPLENIVGGEALIRNLKKGISESEKLGAAMRFSYEVDEFGHTSQLPQILAGFGINGIIAWRGVPNHCRSYFKWLAPDGTAADFFNTNAGYGEATSLPESEEDFTEAIDGIEFKRDGLIKHINSIRELRLKTSDSGHMMWHNGIDHSWAQADILEIIEKVKALFPEIEVKQASPEEYANAVIADLKQKGIEPESFEGELMFTNEPVLETTNALHPRQKRRHYESEKLLVRKVEPLTAFSSLLGAKYPDWAIEREWKYVLENHAHDSLGCCSVDEVYEQVMARYGASLSIGEQVSENALRYIMSCGAKEPSVWLFNLSDTDKKGAVYCTFDVPEGFGGENITLETPDGEKVGMSVLSVATNGDVRYNPRLGHPVWGEAAHFEAIIDAPLIPAFGAVRLAIKTFEPTEVPRNRQNTYFFTEPTTIDNGIISVKAAPNGTFTLTDKRNGAEYPSCLLFTDDGEAGHCYIHVEPLNDARRFTSFGANADIARLYDTPLGAAMEITVKMDIPRGITHDRRARLADTEQIKIKTVITVLKDSAAVGIDIKIDNKSRNHRLRVLFPSYISEAALSESGQAFDEVERLIDLPEPDDVAEMAYLTHPMQDYCAVCGKGRGLAVAARGIYEYECTADSQHALALTLLRSIEVIDNKTFEKTPEYFMEEAQNICEVEHSLCLIPFNGEREEMVGEVNFALKRPFAAVSRDTEDSVMPGYIRPENSLGDVFRALEISGNGIELTTFKAADSGKGIILRLRNRTKASSECSIKLNVPGITFGEILKTDLEEKPLEKLGNGNEIKVNVPPKKLVTLEFKI